MSPNSRGRFAVLLKPNLRTAPIAPRHVIGHLGDTTLNAAMALFPDLGSWLLRSVRGDNLADSPVLAIERLSSQPRPIKDADKDTLVGAILTVGSSLHVALHMLLELLPEDQSRERLGEVLRPTLGQLLSSLQTTLCSLKSNATHHKPATAPEPPAPIHTPPRKSPGSPSPNGGIRQLPGEFTPNAAGNEQTPRQRTMRADCQADSPIRTSIHAQQSRPTTVERFPPLEDDIRASRLRIQMCERPGAALLGALQAEMRVHAAIRVAVESLEFAEGQLRLVKEVNQLHGGSKWHNFTPSASLRHHLLSPNLFGVVVRAGDRRTSRRPTRTEGLD